MTIAQVHGRIRATILNALIAIGASKLVVRWWKLRGRDIAHLEAATLAEKFERIYENGHWRQGNSESASGLGSTLRHTESLRRDFPELLAELKIGTLIDVGCGDFNWMKETSLPCNYIGVDIVPSVIETNKKRYEREDVKFAILDATTEPLPRGDAALCREVLFHLSFADSERLIVNILRSGAKYLIATTDPHLEMNEDIPSGAWRERNLEISPFNLGNPIRYIWDGAVLENRRLGVWLITAPSDD